MIEAGFKIIDLPKATHCVLADFPFVSFLSIYMAVWKVYPKMARYIKVKHANKHTDFFKSLLVIILISR